MMNQCPSRAPAVEVLDSSTVVLSVTVGVVMDVFVCVPRLSCICYVVLTSSVVSLLYVYGQPTEPEGQTDRAQSIVRRNQIEISYAIPKRRKSIRNFTGSGNHADPGITVDEFSSSILVHVWNPAYKTAS
ncbi:hypothetical protein PROFUN_09896 [Planoprotostelium fungivorum]|uniref:Uncharacterized protein n=1 Tax=Planoprotostelium fungivorum TaxID=1890364 RepID=A0A2P6NGH2_9EUKA|nr:hypothetical protein PROFUN_09896 [Planoprotostelium fungivorum]